MDSLKATIEVLFGEQHIDSVIEFLVHGASPKNWPVNHVSANLFISEFTQKNKSYTQDQARAAWGILKDKWMWPANDSLEQKVCLDESIFNVLIHFADWVLLEVNNEPVCKFDHLLSWHTLTQHLGEDLFTTAFLAHADTIEFTNRSYFSWEEIIGNDNGDLNTLYSGRMADIHNHLKGTGFSSELNWISLMNDILGRKRAFDSDIFELSKARQTNYKNMQGSASLYVNVIKSAAIRLWIFSECCIPYESQYKTISYEELLLIIKENNELGISTFINALDSKIRAVQLYWGRRLFKDAASSFVVDYAILNRRDLIDGNPERNINCILSGERFLLYCAFLKIYRQDEGAKRLSMLLYIYLLIKNRFFREFLQLNDTVGFSNFADYEVRKELFLKEDSSYKQLLIQTAVDSSLSENGNKYSEQPLINWNDHSCQDEKLLSKNGCRYLETRIAPNDTAEGLASKIALYDSGAVLIKSTPSSIDSIVDVPHPNWDYVVHFIKKEDNFKYKEGLQSPRNWNVRMEVKKQSIALHEFRQVSPNSACRIVGIDAANSEIFCRPEVFAQAFRFLRCSRGSVWLGAEGRERKPIPDLGVTYHVGEDYWDILDGLRSVREALMFLELRGGDRIGHGLVLGTDVGRYYHNRQYVMPMPQQCILDNMAFLLVEGSSLSTFSQIRLWAEQQYEKSFRSIYGGVEAELPPVNTYYQSWLLRGDAPECYTNKTRNVDDSTEFVSYWERSRFVRHSIQMDARRNKVACRLYHLYHYNAEVKKNGDRFEELKVPRNAVYVFEKLQEKILREVELRHISIECNPSSNLKIGEIDIYRDHPIFKFYNLPGCKNSQPHHLRVSVNTDDKGVFSTSLEREFALLAAACEKDFLHSTADVSPREVKVWLKEIMEMAFEMRFRR